MPLASILIRAFAIIAILPAGEPAMALADDANRFAVLVFSRTAGFRHDVIEVGVEAVRLLGAQHGFVVDASEDPQVFTDQRLARYRVVMFLNTTGSVLDAQQQNAFERFIRNGNGFVGVHSATDTSYEWPWYGKLVGAWFRNHPHIQPARVEILDAMHPSTAHLPRTWERVDEWYNFRSAPAG